MGELSHIDKNNRPSMVDVSEKKNQHRTARAKGFIKLSEKTVELISNDKIKKGNVLVTAELSGVMGGKKTFELVPLCHTLNIHNINVDAELLENGVQITGEAVCVGKTGIEMEALTAVNIALLTVYDMCKAVDDNMEMTDIKLVEKYKKDLE